MHVMLQEAVDPTSVILTVADADAPWRQFRKLARLSSEEQEVKPWMRHCCCEGAQASSVSFFCFPGRLPSKILQPPYKGLRNAPPVRRRAKVQA